MATPKWKESYDRWSVRVHERPNQTALLLFASASLGFPPLYVMAVLAGQMKVRLWLFISTCLTGRFIRFLVILGAADWFIHLFTSHRFHYRSCETRRPSAPVLEPHQPRHGGHVRRAVGAEVDRGVVVVPLDAVAGALEPLGAAGAYVDRGEVPAVVERRWRPSSSTRRPARCPARPWAPRSVRSPTRSRRPGTCCPRGRRGRRPVRSSSRRWSTAAPRSRSCSPRSPSGRPRPGCSRCPRRRPRRPVPCRSAGSSGCRRACRTSTFIRGSALSVIATRSLPISVGVVPDPCESCPGFCRVPRSYGAAHRTCGIPVLSATRASSRWSVTM